MIGEYRITGFLGEGGMGVVYRGVHEKLGREAAVKILGGGSQDPNFKTRFLNEARLQAGLHHPNVATLYDFRENGDDLVIFMELVDGECLDELVTKRAFTVDEALTVFASICEAIAYIHEHGIIHRDIKAQNAKLTSRGVVKLLDFGIAKDSRSQGLTQTGGVIGTPNYLSPEQLEGSQASPQTDIWALGILLYEMLTGQLPFKGDTLGGLVRKITQCEFTPPENINPAVPRDVASIVTRCLKRDPAARYGTARELAESVRKVLNIRNASVASHDLATVAITARDKPTPTAPAPVHFHSDASSQPTHEPETFGTEAAKPFPLGLVAGLGGGALLLLLIAVLGIYFVASSGDTPAAKTVSATGGNAVPGKGNTRIRVDVDEGKAEVLRAGQTLGATPLDLDANIGENIALTLRRDGFQDKDIQIQVTPNKKVFTYSLKSK